jgi:hypothetical protein
LQLSSAMQMLHPPCWCPIPISGVRGTGGRHRVPGGGGAGGMGRWHWGSPGVMISHRCFPVVGRFLRAFANCARAQWEHVPPPRTPTCNIMQQFQILIHSGVFVTLQIIFLLGPSRCLYRLTKLFRHIQLSDLCSAWVEYLHITCKIYRDIYIYIYIYIYEAWNKLLQWAVAETTLPENFPGGPTFPSRHLPGLQGFWFVYDFRIFQGEIDFSFFCHADAPSA